MVMEKIEKAFGLPPLSKVADVLNKFPDMPRLRLIKSILETCERLCLTAPDLEKIASLINLIADTPTEKLEKLERVLKQANKLVAKAPTELLELLSSLKEE